jgi:hypothetical protein
MSYTRQHYNLAVENEATQDCDKELGPKVPKTDWDEGVVGGKGSVPHGEEKESHRE